jgi:Flp pilus assembly protein TadD
LSYTPKACDPDACDVDEQAELSIALIWQGDLENAQVAARQAIALNPNCAYAHACSGTCLVFTGQRAEGRTALNIAQSLGSVAGEVDLHWIP